jgi:DMSO/TMAO reductase YedYZ molybdopterin-dependent catalytic subunit
MKTQPLSPELHQQHLEVTRRYFLQLGAVGLAALNTQRLWARDSDEDLLDDATEDLEYLTPPSDFRTVERGKPLPYTLPLEKRLELGLERRTWKLEVIPDPKSNVQMVNPLSREKGNALDFKGLMKLAQKHAVRFLKVMTCLNMKEPLGMGLWEGVPLRNVIWATKPTANIRRAYFYGHHNEDLKQIFQSSLSINRVLEDPPGDNPIILCYKLNGQWLSGRRGAPVRMLVPDAYGFKSVKWLKSVVLTNNHQANDTYAKGNNDIDSQMKTMARFIYKPLKEKTGNPIAITGLAHVGISGLSRVQVWINPQDKIWPKEDPCFTKAPWQDAKILPPPTKWGGDLPEGKLPSDVRFFTREGQPKHWPMRYTIAHWATLLKGVAPGKYDIYCRTIDANGIAQPMPRPFRKSGPNTIQKTSITIEI